MQNYKVNTNKKLREEITERKLLEKRIRESEEKYRKLIETANDAIFVADVETGSIFDTNKHAEVLLGIPADEIIGMHYTNLHPVEEEKRIKKLFEKYAKFNKSITSEDIYVQHKDGRKIPVEISTSVFKLRGKKVIQGIFRDITERKKAEKRLKAHYLVTQVLAEAITMKDAVSKIHETICTSLEWNIGEIWIIDQQENVLRNAEIWHIPSIKIPEFKAITKQITFPLQIGLPGRVWECAKPLWIEDVVRDANFRRASVAAKEGVHGAFGFPILSGSEVLGTINFFSHELKHPDKYLLDMMSAIGI
ncbi:MAG: PAS domain S-box protein, partial [Candidatus Scalindua sp.]